MRIEFKSCHATFEGKATLPYRLRALGTLKIHAKLRQSVRVLTKCSVTLYGIHKYSTCKVLYMSTRSVN